MIGSSGYGPCNIDRSMDLVPTPDLQGIGHFNIACLGRHRVAATSSDQKATKKGVPIRSYGIIKPG